MTLLLASQYLVEAKADSEFGRRQVEQFISDRPETAEVINQHPALRQAFELHFGDKSHGTRVYWDNREPITNKPGQRLRAQHDYPALIQVSRKARAVDQCAALLIELCLSELDAEKDALDNSPPDKLIARDEFVINCIRHEYNALQKAKAFFIKHPIAAASSTDAFYASLFTNTDDFDVYVRGLDNTMKTGYNKRVLYTAYYNLALVRKSPEYITH